MSYITGKINTQNDYPIDYIEESETEPEPVEIENEAVSDEKSKGPKSLINPYELLGLDIKNKNLNRSHVRKAYFELALMCHPDKGGNESDMNVIQQAYKFILEQIKHNQNLTDEKYEDAEKQFNDYYKQQEIDVPPFPDIYHDVKQWREEFNKEFNKKLSADIENNRMSGLASSFKGYGNMMDKSDLVNYDAINNCIKIDYKEYKQKGKGKKIINFEDIQKTYNQGFNNTGEAPVIDNDFFKRGDNHTPVGNMPLPSTLFGKEIMKIDNEPEYNKPFKGLEMTSYYNSGQIEKSSNINRSSRHFNMTDYKDAHSEPNMIDLTQIKEKTTPLEELLKMRQNDRQAMDDINLEILNSGDKIELGTDFKKKNERLLKEEMKRRESRDIINSDVKAKSYVFSNMPINIDLYVENHVDTKLNNNLQRLINFNDDDIKTENQLKENNNDKLNDIENDFIIIDNNDLIRGVKSNTR